MGRPSGLEGARGYRPYLLCLLAAILTLNGLDSIALGLVLPSIKATLHLTDTELGLLTGMAFFAFYSTVGIPIGRWADRGDRVAIIALSTGLWGIMVVLVGAVQSFTQLLLVRIGVAVGEAGCVPSAYSLIGDYFTRQERPRTLGKYLLGNSLSVFLGYLAAGWLSHRYGWRTMFVCLGLPSVIVAPVAWWTLTEPRRTRGSGVRRQDASPSLLRVFQSLWANRTFRCLLGVLSVNTLFGSGLGVWQPSFFARSYRFSAEQLGMYFAVIYGVGGVLGTYSGGYLASRYAPNNERLQLKVVALLNAGFGIVSVIIYLSRDPIVSMLLLSIAVIGAAVQNGPLYAATQTVIPERMRAISVSVMYLFASLVGGGLGPFFVGALSDALHPYLGAESLRYALLAMCPGFLVSGWLLWRAARTVASDTEAVAAQSRESRNHIGRPEESGEDTER